MLPSISRLPIYAFCDAEVTFFERDCVEEALIEFYDAFPGRKMVFNGARQWGSNQYSSPNWYLWETRNRQNGRRTQIDADVLLNLMRNDPRGPHIDVFFTSYDLTSLGKEFCFGVSSKLTTVQSVARYRHLGFRDTRAIIKTMTWHGLGHIFDLSSSDMMHCSNQGCSMRYATSLDELIVQSREVENMHRMYCPECMEKLRKCLK